MRILVVDDSRMMRRVIRDTLVRMGHQAAEIVEACDGMEASDLLANEKLGFDLLLVDWNMPRLDGIGLLKKLRAQNPERGPAVIMVTSQAQRSNVAEALRWGATDYILKPFDSQTLQERIEKVEARIEERKCEDTSVMLRSIASAAQVSPDTPFLERLSKEILEELTRAATVRKHEKGALILGADDVVDALHFILDGEVEVVDADSDRRSRVRKKGECFGELSFIAGRPGGITVRARTNVAVGAIGKAALGDLARKHPRLSYSLSQLIVADSEGKKPTEAEAQAAGLAGRLDTMALSDLVQILHMSQKTGQLVLEKGEGRAELFFESGEIRRVELEDLPGEDGFYRLVGWKQARFTFHTGRLAKEPNVGQPTMTLLMEGMRRMDEGEGASS